MRMREVAPDLWRVEIYWDDEPHRCLYLDTVTFIKKFLREKPNLSLRRKDPTATQFFHQLVASAMKSCHNDEGWVLLEELKDELCRRLNVKKHAVNEILHDLPLTYRWYLRQKWCGLRNVTKKI